MMRKIQIFSMISFFLFLSFQPTIVFSQTKNPLKKLFNEATVALNQGRFEEAIDILNKTIDIYPNFAPTYYYMALAHKELGTEIEQINTLLEQAVTIDPNYLPAHEHLAKGLYTVGEFAKAEQSALKVIEATPDNLNTKLALAWIYLLGMSQPDRAIPYFKEIIVEYDAPYAFFGLGMAYFMENERIKVMDMVTQLRRIESESLAIELENMIRDRNSFPEFTPGKPLIRMQANQQPILVKDLPVLSQVNQPGEQMPVRLRKSNATISPAVGNITVDGGNLSGEERIKALQEKGLYLRQDPGF